MLISKINRKQDGRILTFDEQKRAPKGGITVKGKEFRGGEFIPKEYHTEFEKEMKKKKKKVEPKKEVTKKNDINKKLTVKKFTRLDASQRADEKHKIRNWYPDRKNFAFGVLNELSEKNNSKSTRGYILSEKGKTISISKTHKIFFDEANKWNNFTEVDYIVTADKGYGTKTMLAIIKDAIKENRNGIFLNSSVNAVGFYKKLGMKKASSNYFYFNKKSMKEFLDKFDK